ncbi:hypothetical protein F4776DRAFT_651758 [Hypoxylon sp. NC0597]|nr:hypothetical protein F4776DRAFT_651758 [Hypoxylon sp. NC0597]
MWFLDASLYNLLLPYLSFVPFLLNPFKALGLIVKISAIGILNRDLQFDTIAIVKLRYIKVPKYDSIIIIFFKVFNRLAFTIEWPSRPTTYSSRAVRIMYIWPAVCGV